MNLSQVIAGARSGRRQLICGSVLDLEPVVVQLLTELVELRSVRPLFARGSVLSMPGGGDIELRYDTPSPRSGRDRWRVSGCEVLKL